MKKFKKLTYIFIVVIIGSYLGGNYNSLKLQENQIDRTLAEIQNNLQSRFDTFSSFAETAKFSAELESEVFTQIAKFRSGIESADSTNELVSALNQANTGFRGLLATFENYPEIKSTTQFENFQTEISGMENRLRIARKDFNDASTEFNNMIDVFPRNYVAFIFGFKNVDLFEAEEKATQRPNLTEILNEN